MIRSTLTLTGAMAALAFSAATVHAEPDAPTPFGDLNVPTWFVEAVGPTFFEPWA
jgi:hypothetical protein